MKNLLAAGAVGLALIAASAPAAFAACVSDKCPYAASIDEARGIIQDTCGCTREGQTHGTYRGDYH